MGTGVKAKLVDCTYPSRGDCLGGYAWDAFLFVVNNTGLSSSKLYPYIDKKQRCQKYKWRKLTKIDGYSILPRDERCKSLAKGWIETSEL
ncbi:hypothetical protein Chor_014791 [Crotalus horridus]